MQQFDNRPTSTPDGLDIVRKPKPIYNRSACY